MANYTPKQWVINNLFTSKKLKKLGELINNMVDKVDTVPSVNETAKVQYLTSQDGAITVGQNETPMYILDDTDISGQDPWFTGTDSADVPFDDFYNAVVNNKNVNINIYTSDSGTGTTKVAAKAFVCGSTAYFDEQYQFEPDTAKAIVISGTLIFKSGSHTIAKPVTYYTDESMSTLDPNGTKYVKFIRVEGEQGRGGGSTSFNVINVTTTWDKNYPDDMGFKVTSFPSFEILQDCVINGYPIFVKDHFDGSIFSRDTVALGYVAMKNSSNTEFYIEYVNPTGKYIVVLSGVNNKSSASIQLFGGLLPYHDSTMAGKSLKVMTGGSIAWDSDDYIVTFTVSGLESGNPTVSTTTSISDILVAKNAGKTVKGVVDIGMYSQEFPLTAWGNGALGNGMVAFGAVLPDAGNQTTSTFAVEGDVVIADGVANDRWLLFIS